MIALSRTSFIVIGVGTILLLCALVAVYILYLSPYGYKARENSILGQAERTKEVVYASIDGTPIDMHNYAGELLIVTMWASWSPFTKDDLRTLAALKDEFAERITIRALNRKEDPATALAYLDNIGREEGIEYVIDPDDHLYGFTGGFAMPETLVFDKVGNIITHIRGTITRDELRNTLISSLKNE
jgi:cytochrome c biogenesis protein CcmG, thiol:disulfide interchange protein DsbE